MHPCIWKRRLFRNLTADLVLYCETKRNFFLKPGILMKSPSISIYWTLQINPSHRILLTMYAKHCRLKVSWFQADTKWCFFLDMGRSIGYKGLVSALAVRQGQRGEARSQAQNHIQRWHNAASAERNIASAHCWIPIINPRKERGEKKGVAVVF